ncbi:MAG: vWA domain-containing protein [Pseudomonadota bacterium]
MKKSLAILLLIGWSVRALADPTVVLLVDISGSMNSSFDATTRYNAALAAITTTITANAASVAFGVTLYQGGNFPCPQLESAPAPASSVGVQNLFATAAPGSFAPTGEAIVAANAALAGTPGERQIILLTDGQPATCADPQGSTGEADAVQAAADSFQSGIPVSVISIGDDSAPAYLQSLADAGAGASSGAGVFEIAMTTAELQTAINEIVQPLVPAPIPMSPWAVLLLAAAIALTGRQITSRTTRTDTA